MARQLVLSAILIVAIASIVLWRYTASQHHPPSGDARTASDQFVSFTQEVMTTPVTVLVPRHHGAEAAEVVFDVFRQIDARMSEWKPTSPLTKVNNAAGRDAIVVPPDLRDVIRRGVELGRASEGAFDITWAALWGLWDFKAKHPRVPDDAEIDRRTALVDYRRIVIDDNAGTVFLPESGMMIGLGGIAKGYALESAAAELHKRGMDSFLISAGGQVMVSGTRGDRPWRVGIRDPRGGPTDFFAFLDGSDISLATSGDYERFFVLDGRRYHHILDPRTGRPTRGLRSASVIGTDPTLADGLSTALMVFGTTRGLALAEGLDDVEAVLVDDNGRVHVTSGLAGKLQIEHPPSP